MALPVASPARLQQRSAVRSHVWARAGLILLAVLAISLAHFTLSREGHGWHAIHVAFGALGLLPIVAAALWMSTAGAIGTALLSAGLYIRHAHTSWAGQPYENANQLATAAVYVFTAVVTTALVAGRDAARQRAATAILKAQRDAALQSVASLSNALRHRDDGTGAHCRRVAALVSGIGRVMKLPDARLGALEQAALVHDVGKIGVRDDVLLKRGDLSATERADVERHPTIAADILRPISGAEGVAEIVLAHHENLDGSGYPRGLAAEQIPMEARILRAADVFDALCEERSYKRPLSPTASLAILQAMADAGKLDPSVVAALERTVSATRSQHQLA